METISRTKPKARKEHKCDWCNGTINKGEIYERSFLKYNDIYVWKNHMRCSEIANKLSMFDDCNDYGLDEDTFHELIENEFCILWQKKDIDYYKSKDFKMPDFLGQLDFVCNHYLN